MSNKQEDLNLLHSETIKDLKRLAKAAIKLSLAGYTVANNYAHVASEMELATGLFSNNNRKLVQALLKDESIGA